MMPVGSVLWLGVFGIILAATVIYALFSSGRMANVENIEKSNTKAKAVRKFDFGGLSIAAAAVVLGLVLSGFLIALLGAL